MAYDRGVRFEWDPAKAESNRRKHGITFEEASALFTSGVGYLKMFDSAHGAEEDRYHAVGPVARGLICVVYTERDEETIRILGARRATRRESDLFVRNLGGESL